MSKELLCTLGPASLNGPVIRRLEKVGVTIFRINLSHTKLEQVEHVIRTIREHSDLPICIDSEGAQIRTGLFVEGTTVLRENTVVRAHRNLVAGDPLNINFVPHDIIDRFEVGDFISIDFNSVLAQVIGFEPEYALLRVVAGGKIGSNKAVTVRRGISMPALSEKDIAAMKIGLEYNIRHFALSFANHGADVEAMRAIVGEDAFIISKIECKNGIDNLDEILTASNAVLIDRGDLSREMPLERIPQLQKMIIGRAKKHNRAVYVATNLLESMVTEPAPTRAEVNDIHNTLLDGADGLVLAAETAIGKHPIRCANMIVTMMDCHEKGLDPDSPSSFDLTSLLVSPHGGSLMTSQMEADKIDGFTEMPTLKLQTVSLMDCEQLAHGVYSPLRGFMDAETVHSVLDEMKLPSGASWTMPILLPIDPDEAKKLGKGQSVRLAAENGNVHATIEIEDIFTLDLRETARKWFGTEDDAHPGVARLYRSPNTFIGGPVTLTQRLPSEFQHYNLLPEQSRFIFNHRGWSQVVGFHGRNPPHRAHTFIQLSALERTGADGLFINPVIGPQKAGDFHAAYVLKSYQMMLEFNVYPTGRALLGSFSTYPRFCGPREAVFSATCRQNMGCSHFIVGRDHAGVGDYYGPSDAIKLFERMPDIEIEPVFFDTVYYDPDADTLREGEPGDNGLLISGTRVRDAICNGEHVPDWMMWTPLQDLLLNERAAGHEIVAS